jgi:signal transduction histidine kinase
MSFWKNLLFGEETSKHTEQAQTTAPKTLNTIQALWNLQKIILDTLEFDQVVQKIVDGLLTELGYLDLGYRIIVLTLVDEDKKLLKRISLSSTEEAKKAMQASAIPFHNIDIPLSADENILIRALKDKQPYVTHHWPEMFVPALSAEDALKNQTAAGIKTSMIYPVIVKNKAIGVLIFSMVKHENEVSEDEKDLIRGFTEIVGLAVQDAQLYSSVQETKKNLEAANEKLKELDLLKNEFVSVASHELRTPMTAIKSYLWMALEGKGGELNEKQRYYIQRGYNSVDRLIRLVNDMLNISRIEAGRITIDMQEVDLSKLAQEVVDEVLPRAKEVDVTVTIAKHEKLPMVLADPDKIKEVFFNLIGNSLKFTPKGGHVRVSFIEKDGFIETEIKDTGSGIEADDIGKLFQKFGLLPGSYTTNQPAMGTGLGLYICRSIIELHQGKIWAESEGRNKGASFMFQLKKFNKAELLQFNQSTAEKKESVGLIHSEI